MVEVVYDREFGKHGVSELDADHARRNAIRRWDIENGALLAVGPDQAGNLLEVGYRYLSDELVLIFHADKARDKWINP